MANSKVVLDDKKLQSIIRNEPAKAQLWLDGFTEDLLSRIKLSFNTSPAGRTYTRGSVSHTASIPGQPPNIDIGSLTNSMHWEHDGTLQNRISDGVAHGIMMEDGTENVEPRPFMQPAFADAQKRVAQDMKDHLDIESL